MDLKLVLLPAAALLALLGPASGAAQTYKWVDANGRTHFSDVPPPDGKAGTVKIKPQMPADPQAASRAGDWRSQLQESNVRRAKQQQQQELAEQERRNAERNCANARGDLDTLQRSRVFRYNNAGEREYLDEKGRDAAIAAAQERVDRLCR
ncbi:MAG TPA: DUF4124 domain-containing protein [Rhodocyclaceae bacterium]